MKLLAFVTLKLLLFLLVDACEGLQILYPVSWQARL
jgi:hypothetical protein